ncbi:glycosyl transferase family protein [Lactobacillus selangorensis]|uniref:Glycosyl transferase family protein n=1 Tax=Lactobacillus selangorensis TaxID=81857 RepID=A0A0R2G256_9LACO|nr:glycosyltransferase family A protein [Lactobacillus selangorensis]KRN28111.1 glycosyl transferase family protein [Lactobacillus selangorensis]KRN31012.1 glycosyl transferase family protein [Lactobacillus selangorensis]
MKYLTITVPSYNSEDYLGRCLDSLLVGGENVEILVVNDGSTDRTEEIANEYAAKYPTIVKVINQENEGHGGAVNTGVRNATGKYFKVVDSDDRLDAKSLKTVLKHIQHWEATKTNVDMIVCNYVYEKTGTAPYVVNYRKVFKNGRICGWDDMGRFGITQYLIMHAQIFKTSVIRKSGVQLPLHTFYVDNLFAYQPLPFVETICYLDVDLYRYFIGRDDQSTTTKNMMARIDQQLRVTKMMIDVTNIYTMPHPKLAMCMERNISSVMSISSVLLLMIGTPDAMAKRKDLWDYAKNRSPYLYRRLRYHRLCGLTYLPTKLGSWATKKGYQVARSIVKFQ